MNLTTVTCQRCKQIPVEIPDTLVHLGAVCDICIAQEEEQKTRLAFAQAQCRAWKLICPEIFQDTDIDRLPLVELSQRALKWPFHVPNEPTVEARWVGLNLWGFPGTGKTRTLFLVLKRAHFAALKVKCFGPSQFAQECEMREFKTASWIRGMLTYDILAFDDLDKCKFTRPQEEKFFGLLDARVSKRLPTFFTGNSNGDTLKTMFRNGEAILRRIRESCISIHFPQQQTNL